MNAERTAYSPSRRTGIDALQADRRAEILTYVEALIQAIEAGVAAGDIRNPQAYFDTIVTTRVVDARDDTRWLARLAEMRREMEGWERRLADRAGRVVEPERSSPAGAAAAVAVVMRAQELMPDQRARLESAWIAVHDRDALRSATVLANLRQPELASLGQLALRRVADLDGYQQLQQITTGMVHGARDAALAAFGREALSEPEFAVLYGPWAEAILGDLEVIAPAWGEEADRLRADFRRVPIEAWQEPIDGENDF